MMLFKPACLIPIHLLPSFCFAPKFKPQRTNPFSLTKIDCFYFKSVHAGGLTNENILFESLLFKPKSSNFYDGAYTLKELEVQWTLQRRVP